jgi:hypothetical protein
MSIDRPQDYPIGTERFRPVSRPVQWPYRADPPGRYWGNYSKYQMHGGLVRLEDDVRGFAADGANRGDISRFYFFCLAFDQLMKEGIKGDLAELGVYRGNTAVMLATMARRMGTTAWLLDTFEGFDPAELAGIDAAHKMEFTDTSLDAVRTLVGDANVRYVKGHFPGSSSQMPDRLTFSLVHIDCDLYAPMVEALNYFYPKLVPGGYLIIHDYASLAWRAAEKAVDEFFADKPEPVIPLTDGCSSAVIRKARSGGSELNWLLQRRCALFSQEWTSAGIGGLGDILVEGWSDPEHWGVWGIDASHCIDFYMPTPPTSPVRVEADVAASLLGTRKSQAIDVLTGKRFLTTWNFSLANNRSIRTVTVPLDAVCQGQWGCPMIRLEFRPHSVLPVNQLDPESQDPRQLGLAVYGLRRAG